MSIYDDWSNVPGSIVVQNYNYSATSVASAVQNMGALEPKYIPYPTKFEHIDNIRIPLKYSEVRQYASLGIVSSESSLERSYCNMARQSYVNANTLQAIGYMPRLCPVLLSVPDLIDKYITINTDIMCNLRPEYKGELSGFTHERYDKEFVKAAYADYYVLTSAVIASNDSTSATQITLATLTANNFNSVVYDTFSPWSGTLYGNYYRGFRPYILSNITDINRITDPSSYSSANGYCGSDNSVLFGLIDKGIVQNISPHYSSSCFTVPSGQYFRGMFLARTKSQWQNFFDASGMPWSYNLDDVLGQYDNNLRKPTTPGLPSNPVIDDDGPGNNITDPVEYPDPPYIPNSTVYDRYFLSPNQIPDIKKFLFSDTFMNNIKRLWTNPAEYVISLVCYPFDVVNTGLGTTNDVVSIGGVTSDVVATALTDRGVPYFYGGSVFVDNYYNSYLDYEPYTSIDIYIPYIGVRPLNVSQVVGHTICIGYYIDLNTQQITALLGLDGDNGNLGQVLTQYVGSIGVQAPLSGTSAQDMIRNIVTQTSGLITGIGAIAGGVMGANPALLAAGVSRTSNEILGGGHTAPSYYGSLSPVSGLFTPQKAYLIINRPRQAIPAAYLSQQGFSSSFSGKVSEFSGYLECTSVNMSSGNTMTEQEQNEITRLLTGGIYI